MKFPFELLGIFGPLVANVTHEQGRSLQQQVPDFYVDIDVVDLKCQTEWITRLQEALTIVSSCVNLEMTSDLTVSEVVEINTGVISSELMCKLSNSYFDAMTTCISHTCALQVCDAFDTIETQINSNLVAQGMEICDMSCGYFNSAEFYSLVILGPLAGLGLIFAAWWFLRGRKQYSSFPSFMGNNQSVPNMVAPVQQGVVAAPPVAKTAVPPGVMSMFEKYYEKHAPDTPTDKVRWAAEMYVANPVTTQASLEQKYGEGVGPEYEP